MKIDTSLLQSDPESLDQIPKEYRDDNQLSFFIRVQKNIRYHRFVEIIKVILYLQLILGTAVIGCIALSNYYSSQSYNDNTINPPTPAGDRSRLNLDTVGRISWRANEADTIIITKQSQNPTKSAKFVVIGEDDEENEKPTSSGKITLEVNEDNGNKLIPDLSKIEEVLHSLDKQEKLPVPKIMSVTSSSKIDDASSSSPLLLENSSSNLHSINDIVSSDEENVSEDNFLDNLDDEKILLLFQKLIREKVENDMSSDSESSAEELPLINLKSKRSAENSSNESPNSSSIEWGNAEQRAGIEQTIAGMTRILSETVRLDCDETSIGKFTPNGDHAKRARRLMKRLLKGTDKVPKPVCKLGPPVLGIDFCGNFAYRCVLDEIAPTEEPRKDEHTGQ